MERLDDRKRTILHAIVVEYVDTAEPVASEQLVQRYPLGVKSATVRNEMAELSELGLLEQPHTSAGRIPSDQGYRFFVDRLVLLEDVQEKARESISGSPRGEVLQTLLRDTTKALSRVSGLLGVATTVRNPNLTVRTAILSALGPNQALFVLALSDGRVENRMLECPADLTLEDVGAANEALRIGALGTNIRALVRSKAPAAGTKAASKLVQLAWTELHAIARTVTRGEIMTEGEEFLFSQPEFRRDIGGFQTVLSELVDSDVLYETVSPAQGPLTVTIGREHRHATMHQLSVVRRSFYVGSMEAGMIALVGPTRMRYGASIPLVNHTADALSESLTRFFG
ncbi:heat-inducible transcription repressor HrcA [bacterium]|nr:MAG: heat-inducible transcription repressor HrcA [bacterium]